MGITAQGRALIARTKNGEQLTFTKIKIGTGVLPAEQTEASRTSLVTFLKDVPITAAYLKTPEQFNIKVLFSNEGLTEAKRVTEQGIYAKIGNEAEVLYAYYYVANGFIDLPVPTGDRYLKSVKEFGLKTSDTGNAQVIIDGLIVHPTIEDMNRELQKIRDDVFIKTVSEENYVGVRNPRRTLSQKFYEFWDSVLGYAGLEFGYFKSKKSNGTVVLEADVENEELKGSSISTSGSANKIFKWSDVNNTIKTMLKIKKTDTQALRVEKDDDTEVFNINSTSEEISGSAISTSGGANKLLKFSDVANTIKHVFAIMKSSYSAFTVKNDSGTDVFNIDTFNNEVSGTSISESAIAKKAVKRDSNGEIANVFNTSGVFFRKVLTIPLFTRVPNENFDILIPIPNGFSGRLKVKLLGASNYGNGTGVIEKTFNLGLPNATTIDCQITSYTDVEGYLSEYVAIKNAVVSNGNLKITVVKKDQTKDIVGRVILEVDSYLSDVIKNATLSAVYIVDNSAEPLPTFQSKGRSFFESPIFTGAPQTEDIPWNDSSKRIPNSKWVFGGSVYDRSTNGYIKLPSWLGGIIIQWGVTSTIGDSSDLTVTFPVAFTTSCFQAFTTNTLKGNFGQVAVTTLNLSNMVLARYNGGSNSCPARWFAIGY